MKWGWNVANRKTIPYLTNNCQPLLSRFESCRIL